MKSENSCGARGLYGAKMAGVPPPQWRWVSCFMTSQPPDQWRHIGEHDAGMDKMEWGGGRQWQFSASKRGGGLSDTRGGISRHKINFFLKGQLTALIFQWNEARNRFTEDIPASYFFFTTRSLSARKKSECPPLLYIEGAGRFWTLARFSKYKQWRQTQFGPKYKRPEFYPFLIPMCLTFKKI